MPLDVLGSWSTLAGEPLQTMRLSQNIHWSLWPHGFVHLQIPNQAGLAYVLKYALKDQFNVLKSRGTMRESRAELHAASLFRMSKKPPIGARFIEQKLQRLLALRSVPASLQLTIPNYSGYWYPNGNLRKQYCAGIYTINEAIKKETGRECPQFQTLLSTLSLINNVNDLEILHYGQSKENIEAEAVFDRYFSAEIREKAALRRAASSRSEIVRTCGQSTPCRSCFDGFSPEIQAAVVSAAYKSRTEARARGRGAISVAVSQPVCNPFCLLRTSENHLAAFAIRKTPVPVDR
jgi:hypothetical protein